MDKITETAREDALNQSTALITSTGGTIYVPNRELVKIPGRAPKSCTHPNWKAYIARKVGGFSSSSVLKNFNIALESDNAVLLQKDKKKSKDPRGIKVDPTSAQGIRKEQLQIEQRASTGYVGKGEILVPQPIYDEFNPRSRMSDCIAKWNIKAPEEEVITPTESEDEAPPEQVAIEEPKDNGKMFDFNNPSLFTADDEGTMMQWDMNLNLINCWPGAGEGCIWTMSIDYSMIFY